MLFEMLCLSSSLEFLFIAVGLEKHTNAGVAGYALAVLIGLVLGAANEWAVRTLGVWLYHRPMRYSHAVREWCLGAYMLSIVVWPLCAAGFLGLLKNSN
jgi:hypothetical protein